MTLETFVQMFHLQDFKLFCQLLSFFLGAQGEYQQCISDVSAIEGRCVRAIFAIQPT